MDKIFFQAMRFYGYHGVYPEENRLGQRFIIDLELGVDLAPAGRSDSLDDTVDYGAVYDAVKKKVEGEPVKLVETLAERVVGHLFDKFSAVKEIFIRVTKPDPPIPGHYRAVGVELHRKRGDFRG